MGISGPTSPKTTLTRMTPGASSLCGLRGHVRRAGYEPVNVDAFVVLGTVKLRPHIDQMRANVADALGLEIGRVSVKARSNDGLGPEGEGVACGAWASVMVRPRGGSAVAQSRSKDLM